MTSPSVADHPHTGGESSPTYAHDDVARGSSPHGWGKRVPRLRPEERVGIIPTRVGKATRRSPGCRPRRDHPHTGGESRVVVGEPDEVGGSSPHGWGKTVLRVMDGRAGSSPHGWGKRGPGRRHAPGPGIIPTRVGKARRLRGRVDTAVDHPHTGGESVAKASSDAKMAGSSPHGWGKRERPVERLALPGIIPTRVGKAERPQPEQERPRGSSPHGWGKRGLVCSCRRRVGIIPTRVGKARTP